MKEPGTSSLFTGVYSATATPFRDDGSLDLERYQEHCSWQVEAGVTGIVPNGSLGEYEALTGDERAAVVKAVIEAVGDRAPVVPGVAGPSSLAATRWAEQAADAGATAVMLLPPTSHGPTDDEVTAHFQDVARVGLPIVAYNNPFSTRVDLTPNLLARLAEIEQVQAVKEFSQDARRVAQIREVAPRLEVICGCDDVFVESMLLGASGWIAGFVNALPGPLVRLYEHCVKGDYPAAADLYLPLLPLLRWDADPRFVQAIKLAQEEVGRYGGPVRPPRLPLSPADQATVRQAVKTALVGS